MGLLFVRGNMLGLIMFVAVSPIALIGGFVLKLADPITMSGVGLGLVVIDLVVRFRSLEMKGWLINKEYGGYFLFLPVWIFGIVVIGMNVFDLIANPN